jgi:hypothetical protein
MEIIQQLVTMNYKFTATVKTDDLRTHSAMQDLDWQSKLLIRNELLEILKGIDEALGISNAPKLG